MSRAGRARGSRCRHPWISKMARPRVGTSGGFIQAASNEIGQSIDCEIVRIAHRTDQMRQEHAHIKGLLQEEREFRDFQGVDIVVVDQGCLTGSSSFNIPLRAYLVENVQYLRHDVCMVTHQAVTAVEYRGATAGMSVEIPVG